MLMDVLAIIIGFAAVMLLLSLIVTSLVQVVQQITKMRFRNLRSGLEELFRNAEVAEPREQAQALLDEISLDPPPKGGDRLADFLTSGQRTWITPEELKEAVEAKPERAGKLPPEKLQARFQQMEPDLSRRFRGRIRLLTVALSFGVAFLFQVSAPDLLRELKRDSAMRAAGEILAGRALDLGEVSFEAETNYEAVSDEALDELAEEFPDLREELEEAAGIGASEAQILAEVDLVLADHPQRGEVVQAYERILDRRHGQYAQEAAQRSFQAASYLDVFGFTPWRDGREFYTGVGWIGNLLGVLLTTLALSFGAPFWFHVLSSAVGLRDALKPKSADSGGGS